MQGKQARYFDDQSVVNIGGRSPIPSRRKRRVITHPFAGIISGLAYNDLRIMDMAASGDSRIHFEGDVSLVSSNTIWDFVTEPFPTIALTTANVTQEPDQPEIPEPEPSPHVGGNKTMTRPTKVGTHFNGLGIGRKGIRYTCYVYQLTNQPQ